MNNKMIRAWIEAMRLRTLPVSVAGVVCAIALSCHLTEVRWIPATICLIFAVLCQIASNFANEYYDYRDGLDKPGRSGPRRGVTEGDIRPSDMKVAAFGTLFIALILGLWLIYWGGAWLIIVGVAIAIGAIFYSAGPYPLSRNGLGEVAVLCFFGLVPVNFTFLLATGYWEIRALTYSLVIGFMAANVLIVNNFRDADEDILVGKRTIANILGRGLTRTIYLFNGITAFLLSLVGGFTCNMLWIASVIYLPLHLAIWSQLKLNPGESPSKLNPLLGMTSCLMLLFSIMMFI